MAVDARLRRRTADAARHAGEWSITTTTYGLGGDRSADNIRLMCSCHNAYMAELDYGKEKMDPYRRSADRVREPQPSFDYEREKKSRFPREMGMVGPHCELTAWLSL